MKKKETQEYQVIKALKSVGGFATLRRLNEIVDFSTWKTKTPEASVRRIVQHSHAIFRIQPGLWALEDCREQVLKMFKIKEGDRHSDEQFSHGYYQGLLVEIGKLCNRKTYVPSQDRNRLFLDKHLGDVADTCILPEFTYENLLRKARSVDVIWFNERGMPADFYEVEHTTDMKNSLSKFYELQDFYSKFYIVAHVCRKVEFCDKINVSIYDPIRSRVQFLDYGRVARVYTSLRSMSDIGW